MEILKDKAKKYNLHATNRENVGFGKGEMKTKSGGKIFKRVARYDPPHKLEKQDIPFSHYNIEGRDFKKGLHVLVKKG